MAKKPKIKEGSKGIKFTTPMFRLSFPKLFKAEAYKDGGREAYQIAMLFKKDQDLKVAKNAIIGAAKEAFGDKANWPKNLKMPWKDGDAEDFEGYAGHYVLNAKTYADVSKPVVVDRDKNRIEDPQEVYAGCYCRAVLTAKATSNGSDFFISLYLQAVQKIKDGERLGGGVNLDEDFDELEDEENEFEMDEGIEDQDEADEDDDMGF